MLSNLLSVLLTFSGKSVIIESGLVSEMKLKEDSQ